MAQKRNILITAALAASVALAVWLSYDKLSQESLRRHRLRYRKMVDKIDLLYQSWREGPEDWKCGTFFDPDIPYEKAYLRCNPDLLKCRLQREEGIRFKRFAATPLWNEFGIVLEYEDGDLKREFIFYDDCKEAILPEGVYGLGEYRRGGDFVWDNFNRAIAFDRILVSRQDILNWLDTAEVGREAELREANEGRHLRHFPAHGLLLDEMRAYCRFQGKRLMQAHIWDAASFIPADPKRSGQNAAVRAPYPWTRNRRSSFLERAKEEDISLETKDCSLAYVKGCESLSPWANHIYGQPSWSGMFQTLGGTMEVVDNPFRPGRNLKISSRHLPPHSPWHRLGRRGRWDGEGLFPRNVNFGRYGRQEGLEAPLEIGFRCMRNKSPTTPP